MTAEPRQRPQEPRKSPTGTPTTSKVSEAAARLQAALDARSGDLRARAVSGGLARSTGCQPGCPVCALTAVTPNR